MQVEVFEDIDLTVIRKRDVVKVDLSFYLIQYNRMFRVFDINRAVDGIKDLF